MRYGRVLPTWRVLLVIVLTGIVAEILRWLGVI